MADFQSMPYGRMTPYTPSFKPTESGSPFERSLGSAYELDENGRPRVVNYNTIGDASTGLLLPQYQATNQLNTGALETLRSQAQDLGPSRWRTLMQSDAMNNIAQQQASGLAQAKNQLASAGGLRSGQAERLASNALQSGLGARQNAWSQLALQDENTRQATLRALPGMDLAEAQYKSGIERGNIGSALQEIQGRRAFDQGQYGEAMRGWAAEQTANALPAAAQAGGGLLGMGGLLGTGIGGQGGLLGSGWGSGGAFKGGTMGAGYVGDIVTAPISAPIAIGKSIGIGGGK